MVDVNAMQVKQGRVREGHGKGKGTTQLRRNSDLGPEGRRGRGREEEEKGERRAK
jgi:hypothetical protein